jgi:hypothetical protein
VPFKCNLRRYNADLSGELYSTSSSFLGGAGSFVQAKHQAGRYRTVVHRTVVQNGCTERLLYRTVVQNGCESS